MNCRQKKFLVGSATMSVLDEIQKHIQRRQNARAGSLSTERRTRKHVSKESHQFGEQLGDRNREGTMGTREDKRAFHSQL